MDETVFPDLRSYLEVLRKRHDIVEIECPVDPHLEAAEIHRRVIAEGGPALFFRAIRGSRYPVVTNLYGTKERIDLVFGDRARSYLANGVQLLQNAPEFGLRALWTSRGLIGQTLKTGLKHSRCAAVLESHDHPARLMGLPVLTTWAEDGGPFFTLPLVYTEHPTTKQHNLGIYRMQRYSETETGLHCQIGKGGGFHLAQAKDLGRHLPVNVFLGGPPAVTLAAVAPLPENVPELLFASLVLGQKIRLAKNPLGPLPLLADAEFVLVGTCDPNEMRPEGPFGDHYGYYSLQHDYPVFRCQGVFHRKDPIYPATVVGKPRQEDFFLGDCLQEILSPLYPVVMPNVRSLWSYGETGYHSLSAAVVKERYKREALAAAFRILGEGQLSLTKFLILVDREMNLRQFEQVLEYALERFDPRTDLYVFANLSMDTLDYTGPKINEGSKGVLVGMGAPKRALPREFQGELPPGISKAAVFCGGCLVLSGETAGADQHLPQRIAESPLLQKWPLIVLVDDAQKAAQSPASFLWTVFTRFEPAADICSRSATLRRFHAELQCPIVIDARLKPAFPAELECDETTKRLVDRRWREYFPSGLQTGRNP